MRCCHSQALRVQSGRGRVKGKNSWAADSKDVQTNVRELLPPLTWAVPGLDAGSRIEAYEVDGALVDCPSRAVGTAACGRGVGYSEFATDRLRTADAQISAQ